MVTQRLTKWLHDLDSISDRKFSFFVAIASLAGILVFFMPTSLFSIEQVIQQSEMLDTQKEVTRAEGILNNELSRLEKSNRDYAVWDDTYQFAQDGNQDYVDTNLDEASLANLSVNFFSVISQDGQIRVVRSIDLADGKENQLPFDLNGLLLKYPLLLQNDEETGGHQGIVILGDQAMLVTSQPVLTSLRKGPVVGSLILGVYLDKTEIGVLSSLNRNEIGFWLPGQTGLPGVGEARKLVTSGKDIVTRPLDDRIIAGYQALEDINGQPGLIVQVNNPRQLYQQGKTIAIYFCVLFVVLSLILAAIEYRLVLSYIRTRRSRRQAMERFGAILSQSSDAILLADEHGKILDANPASLKMLKLEKDAIRKISLNDILTSNQNPLLDLFSANGLNGSLVSEYRCRLSDGTYKDLEVSVSAIQNLDVKAYSTIMRDVTARKEAQEALRSSEERYMLATRGANDGLWDWDVLTDHVHYSERWAAMLGYRDEEIASSPYEWFDRVHPDDRMQLKGILDEHLNKRTEYVECQHRMLHKDGEYRWMLARGMAVWNAAGFAQRMAGSLTDITIQKRIEEQLRHDALHDKLTGLGNRTLMLDRLAHVNQRKRRNPEMLFAVLFLDLDRFKLVNDSYGHQIGDLLLIEISHRLEASLRSMDTVVRAAGPETLIRIAGDEFVILLEDIRQRQDAEWIADRILTLVAQPFCFDGKEITISTSVGIVVPEKYYEQPEDIIRDADIAMYKAKQRRGNTAVYFSQSMYDAAVNRMQEEYKLRQAIAHHEFVIHYQPIHALPDDSVIGFEALVRWNHPSRGLLMPKDFIGLAEETGLIVGLGYEVLRTAINQVKQWQQKYDLAAHMIISVNLSARQLASPDLLTRIKMILDEVKFDPQWLWLEITETTLIEQLDAVQPVLSALRKLGIHIEIDDFGVGYSSLSYLQHLPVDGFKIDRSFINEIPGDGKQIVNTLVELGKNLGLRQVAEGVETMAQKEYLRKLTCDYIQGYLMARPMSIEQMESFLSGLIAGQSICNDV